jgi:GLPGLI family protein
MKRTIILMMFLLSINTISKAQFQSAPHYALIDKFKVMDSAYLKCTYKLTWIYDTLFKTKTSTDIQTLQIGKEISKYFSRYVLDYNTKIQELIQKGAQAIPNPTELGSFGYEVFKFYPKGKYTITDFGTGRIGKNIHEESIPDLKWEILMEYDTVLSYRCQKATTKFRGRNYEAWFTPDIPISNGPRKLGGLPGLILKVSDVQHYFNFECIGLETLKKKEPIKFYQLNYEHIERTDLNKLYNRYYNDPVGFAKRMGVESVIWVNGKISTDVKFPYNPMELE